MNHRKKGFTLIELIIVVVIIGILALVAIPRYFANVTKAQKSQVYANLDAMRQAVLSYYAVYGDYPADYSFPITVIVDGDTVVNVTNPDPSSSKWSYYFRRGCLGSGFTCNCVCAQAMPGYTCYYALCVDSGLPYQSCTP